MCVRIIVYNCRTQHSTELFWQSSRLSSRQSAYCSYYAVYCRGGGKYTPVNKHMWISPISSPGRTRMRLSGHLSPSLYLQTNCKRTATTACHDDSIINTGVGVIMVAVSRKTAQTNTTGVNTFKRVQRVLPGSPLVNLGIADRQTTHEQCRYAGPVRIRCTVEHRH